MMYSRSIEQAKAGDLRDLHQSLRYESAKFQTERHTSRVFSMLSICSEVGSGRVDGNYHVSHLPVKSERAGFPALGFRKSFSLSDCCSCGYSGDNFYGLLRDF